jgi:hypothetical protein
MDKTVSVSDVFKGSPFAVRSSQFAVPFTVCRQNAEKAHQPEIPKFDALVLALVPGDWAKRRIVEDEDADQDEGVISPSDFGPTWALAPE